MSAESGISVQVPEKLAGLYEPRRYKVMHGGRGGGKSHTVARVLLEMASRKPLRVLCAREIQKSMRDSVHRLLKDQVVNLNATGFYEVLDNEIRGANGSLFLFSGLQSHTVDSIKSFEGVDIVWVEEAHGVSKKSWDVLIPTIRKEASEIWLTLNPDLDTDETYERFIATPSPDTWVCEINWRDNPWFPLVLDEERKKAKRTTSKEDYEHIWEGKPRGAVDGAIFASEIVQAQREGRVTFLPHDPKLKTHIVFDLGWNDSMVVAFVQRHFSSIRIIDCIKDSHRVLDSYAQEIIDRGYRLGKVFLPHDGYHKDFKTGKSAAEMLKRYFKAPGQIRPVPKMSIEAGIKAARSALPMTAFDKTKADPIVSSLKRYRRAIASSTQEPGAPLHDDASHGADCYRYISLCAEQMSNEDERAQDFIQGFNPLDSEIGY